MPPDKSRKRPPILLISWMQSLKTNQMGRRIIHSTCRRHSQRPCRRSLSSRLSKTCRSRSRYSHTLLADIRLSIRSLNLYRSIRRLLQSRRHLIKDLLSLRRRRWIALTTLFSKGLNHSTAHHSFRARPPRITRSSIGYPHKTRCNRASKQCQHQHLASRSQTRPDMLILCRLSLLHLPSGKRLHSNLSNLNNFRCPRARITPFLR